MAAVAILDALYCLARLVVYVRRDKVAVTGGVAIQLGLAAQKEFSRLAREQHDSGAVAST
jgi:hypothetical protein